MWGELYANIFKESRSRTIPTCVGRTSVSQQIAPRNSDHPHVCGENAYKIVSYLVQGGPSPRVWGELLPVFVGRLDLRTIPTCVGRTASFHLHCKLNPDHPHVCGENVRAPAQPSFEFGPSPRVWGEQFLLGWSIQISRTIPTCVGRTLSSQSRQNKSSDHPHVCGENDYVGKVLTFTDGPSPRVWGEQSARTEVPELFRTIPTCVGRTMPEPLAVSRRPDHPHVCGENYRWRRWQAAHRGPSPRVWGEQLVRERQFQGFRTIPTCVGRTQVLSTRKSPFSDHPHVCGENNPSRYRWPTTARGVGKRHARQMRSDGHVIARRGVPRLAADHLQRAPDAPRRFQG